MELPQFRQTYDLTQLKPKTASTSPLTAEGANPGHKAKGDIVDDWTIQMWHNHKGRVNTAHIGDTPEAIVSSEQVTLQYRTLQDLFFVRAQLSRLGNIIDFPNT